MTNYVPNHAQIESLILASQLCCVFWDKHRETWVVSPGLAQSLGLVPEWHVWEAQDWRRSVHAEDMPLCQVLLASPMPFDGEARADFTIRLQHQNGAWRWFRFEAAQSFDQSAEISLYRLTDMTEARQDRAAMVDSQMHLRNLYELAPVAIIRWSREGRIIDWNRMAESMFGHARDEAIGQKLAPLLLAPEEYERFSGSIGAAVKTGVTSQLICRSCQANGSSIMCDWRTVALRGSNGSLLGLFSIAFDVSASLAIEDALRKSKDQAEALSRAKTEFMALISHELRTPLNGVIGMAQILEMTAGDAEREVAESIRSSGEKLLAILNEILEYTNIDARSVEASSELFCPQDVLCAVGERFGVLAERKHIGFAVAVDPRLAITVSGDRRSFEKLLVTLLDNAVKFTEQGEVHVAMTLLSQTGSQCSVRCAVSDTGPGISPDYIDQLYLPFKQQERFLVRRQGGMGLGLALAKKLIYRLEGKLELEQTSDAGCLFALTVAFQLTS